MINADSTLRDFFNAKQADNLAASTRDDYLIQLDHFEAYYTEAMRQEGATPRAPTLRDLSPGRVTDAVTYQRRRGRSALTADKVRRTVLAIWNLAADTLDDFAGPTKKIRGCRKPKLEPIAWTIEEVGKILWAAESVTHPKAKRIGDVPFGQWLHGLIWVVYNSGLRINAIMLVRRADLSISSRRLFVPWQHQKDKEGQTITLKPEAVEAITPIVSPQRSADLVFGGWPFDKGGRQWPALNHALKKTIVAAGLADTIGDVEKRDLWHKFRRSFATHLYKQTGDLEAVRRFMGHSSIDVTRNHYIDQSQLGQPSQADLLPTPTRPTLRVFTG